MHDYLSFLRLMNTKDYQDDLSLNLIMEEMMKPLRNQLGFRLKLTMKKGGETETDLALSLYIYIYISIYLSFTFLSIIEIYLNY